MAQNLGPQAGDVVPFTLTVNDLGTTTAVVVPGSLSTAQPLAPGGGLDFGTIALSEGVDPLTFAVTNEAGLVTTLTRTIMYDKTPPTGTFVTPSSSPGTYLRGSINLTVSASDALTGVASVAFQVDSLTPTISATAVATSPGDWLASFNTTTIADGPHTLTATLTDGAGNSAQISEPFVVDNQPPTLAVTAPAPNGDVNKMISITATASDTTSGVAELTIAINGNTVATCSAPSATPCTTSFDTTRLPDGPFTIEAAAKDVAGNAAQPVDVSETSINNAPALFLVSPTQGQRVTTSMNVAVNVTDKYFQQVQCFVGGSSPGISTNPTFSTAVDLLGQLDGALSVQCSAQDVAGNVGTQSASVTVSNWTERFRPHELHLGSGDRYVRMAVLNTNPKVANVDILLPIAGRDFKLRAAGRDTGAHCRRDCAGPVRQRRPSRGPR